MSLDELKQRLELAELKPHTLVLEGALQQLLDALSPAAAQFLGLAWGERIEAVDLLASEPLADGILDFYRRLDRDARLEVMGLLSFFPHEMTHRVDLLTTPFGVGFHGRACLEFIGLQNDFGELYERLRCSPEHEPLRDVERTSDAWSVNTGSDALKARARYFDSLRGAPRRFVQGGWGDDVPLQLFGWSLRKVMVHDEVASVELPDTPGLYLRPLTLLEGRAVAVSAQNLLIRLGADQFAASEVASYLDCFYGSRKERPDYVFLLDLYARLYGEPSFIPAIRERGPAWLHQALMVTVVTGWYALHAPPFRAHLGETAAFADASPVIRLIAVLRAVEQAAVRNAAPMASGVDFLEAIDRSELAARLGLRPVEDVLRFSLDYIRSVRNNNRLQNAHEALREHFDLVLGAQERQMAKRVEEGYISFLGMPDDGDFVFGLSRESDASILAGPNPNRAPEVDAWFCLRENLLFRYARPEGFWDELDDYLRTTTLMGACPQCQKPSMAHVAIPKSATVWSLSCPDGHVFEVNLTEAHGYPPGTEAS
jgi:hypothetical protein